VGIRVPSKQRHEGFVAGSWWFLDGEASFTPAPFESKFKVDDLLSQKMRGTSRFKIYILFSN
jgi:hypothetical protein